MFDATRQDGRHGAIPIDNLQMCSQVRRSCPKSERTPFSTFRAVYDPCIENGNEEKRLQYRTACENWNGYEWIDLEPELGNEPPSNN